VDKSELMLKVLHGKPGMVVTRPSGWGKTTNLNMLRTFFDCPLNPDGSINNAVKHFNRALFIGDQQNAQF
jgi:hypothetical protein